MLKFRRSGSDAPVLVLCCHRSHYSLVLFMKIHTLSPALLSRIERLSGCQGQWIVDCREIEGGYSFALRSLSNYWIIDTEDGQRYWHSLPGVPIFKMGTPEDAAQYCAATRWKAKLLFSSPYLDADCSWPGGYEASSVCRSNNRTFKDEFSKELEDADGDAYGLSLDVRFITEEMIETIESLENYPLLSEDDHSSLEMEDQDRAWTDFVEREFTEALTNRLSECLQTALHYTEADETAEEIVDNLPCLRTVFEEMRQQANEYWQEERGYGQWINVERILESLPGATIFSILAITEAG